MFSAAFAASGLEGWAYQKLPLPPELFTETVRALPAAGFAGINVTIPHKHAALALADEASDAALEIGAANTLSFSADGRIAAENTDAPGLLAALGAPLAGLDALVLGAGGSARAVVWALARGGARRVMVTNRTAERARELADELGAEAVPGPVAADVLVNCTAVGLGHASSEARELECLGLSADDIRHYRYVVDLVYRDGDTALARAARAAGATLVDGLEVLVHQGALSFERWTGRPAPLAAMSAAARGTP
jgi:shikimate dehydrogenase